MTKEIIENDPYKSAGVDIDAGNELIEKIKADVASTQDVSVLGNIGGFAGMYEIGKEFEEPILVACTDGVGTKVSLAMEYNYIDGIGQDLVAMCVNDLIVTGAKPLFFLDYYAASKLDVDHAAQIIKSIAEACKNSGCALLGGETAEMPGHYLDNNFDLAGFSVGCVEKKNIIDMNSVCDGDILIGIESSGPHSNGFSLIRKILAESDKSVDEKKAVAAQLLEPTILYPTLISSLLKKHEIKSMSHITGGGLTENLPRSIPEKLCVELNVNSWDIPTVFKWLQSEGNIHNDDMFKIFNCGIGMVLFVDSNQEEDIRKSITEFNFKNYKIGTVSKTSGSKEVIFS
tara:strand:- start:312 stop:1343 length:1032 start_codon:yes stop_codon:yes gene_type:complete